MATEEDYNGAVEAILRLQQVYQLYISDIEEGIIRGVKANKPLEPYDLWALGWVNRIIASYNHYHAYYVPIKQFSRLNIITMFLDS